MAFFAPCYGVIQQIVKRNGKTKCIALVHNMIPHEPSVLDKVLAPFYVKQTDGFVALSDSVVKDIASLDKQNKPKTFSPHPVYDHYGEKMTKKAACEALGLDNKKNYMLFFGLVRAYKGLDLLLDAFGKVKDELKDEEVQKLLDSGKQITDEKIEESLNYDLLSKEEQAEIDEFNRKINIEDATEVLQYGAN